MTRIETLSQPPQSLEDPIDYYLVDEGRHFKTSFTPERPYLVTFGLYVCKGLTIYNPNTKNGLLAHMAYVNDPDEYIDSLVGGYEDDIRTSDVYIAQATQDAIPQYPDVTTVATSIARYDPLSITLDTNTANLSVRGIALNLQNGEVYEADYSTMDQWSKSQVRPNTASMSIMYER